MNTLGVNLRLTTFGESHGPAMGGVIDGFPPGFHIDFGRLQEFVDKRRPGSSPEVTRRREADRPEFLSGFSPDGLTLGSPIAFIVRNTDCRSSDYSDLEMAFRPNHADYTYLCRYGIRDVRGGGRASARDTVSRVIAGGLARQWLESKGVSVSAWLHDEERVRREALRARELNDSIGGLVIGKISGLPRGLGNPVFGKFQSMLAAAMLAINASMGFDFGIGFKAADLHGSEMLDLMNSSEKETSYPAPGNLELHPPVFSSNNCGGLNGGITNGCDVCFRVAFKPTPTISREIPTVGQDGESRVIAVKGRHDPCVAIRAVPVVEAVAAFVAADFMLGDPRPDY